MKSTAKYMFDEDFASGEKPTMTVVEDERRRVDAEAQAHRKGFAAGQAQAQADSALAELEVSRRGPCATKTRKRRQAGHLPRVYQCSKYASGSCDGLLHAVGKEQESRLCADGR